MNVKIRRFIAGLEIAGGFAGLYLTSTLTMAEGLNLRQRLVVSAIGIPFALCAYAGRALWRDEVRGYWLSILVQALQVPAWSSPTALYTFYCGLKLGVWIGPGGFAPIAGVGSNLSLSWASRPYQEAIGINVLALLLLVQLWLGCLDLRTSPPPTSVEAPA